MSNTTSNIQTARAALTALEAQMDKRAVEAENSKRKVGQLRQSISRLQGSMELDGADFTEQIANARVELAEAERVVRFWPDVETELKRRISEARSEVGRHEMAAQHERLHELASQESSLRSDFYQKGLDFLALADQLVALLEKKEALRRQIHQAGGSTRDVLVTELPIFFPGWPRVGNGVQLAREAWKLD